MRRLAPWLPLVALALLTVLFAGYALNRDPQVKPDALVGRPIPAVALPPLGEGPPVPLPAALQGTTLVNVFASWCAPCEVEHPQLISLQARGLRIVGVAYKDEPAATRAFLTRLGDPFAAVLVDRDGRAGVELGISGVPETFLVGPDGIIRAKHSGPLTPEAAEALLATQSPRSR